MEGHVKSKHLASWYFGTFCYRCGRIDSGDYGRGCRETLHKIADGLKNSGIEMMTHKEFRELIKNDSTFCRPINRVFHECPTCKALGLRF